MEQESKAMTSSTGSPPFFLSEQSISKKRAHMGEEVALFFGQEFRKKRSQIARKLGDKWQQTKKELNK